MCAKRRVGCVPLQHAVVRAQAAAARSQHSLPRRRRRLAAGSTRLGASSAWPAWAAVPAGGARPAWAAVAAGGACPNFAWAAPAPRGGGGPLTPCWRGLAWLQEQAGGQEGGGGAGEAMPQLQASASIGGGRRSFEGHPRPPPKAWPAPCLTHQRPRRCRKERGLLGGGGPPSAAATGWRRGQP